MRKLIFVMAVLVFALVSKTTGAQSSVSLDSQSSGTITFVSDVLSIPALGTVTGFTNSATGGLSTATTYALGPGTATFTPTTPGNFTTSGTFGFELNGGTLLKGTLTLGNAFVTGPPANIILTFNGILTVTSGSVCAPACPEYNVTLTFDLVSGTTYKLIEGHITEVTPEPSSMLLFGTGLLAFGVILRRRLT